MNAKWKVVLTVAVLAVVLVGGYFGYNALVKLERASSDETVFISSTQLPAGSETPSEQTAEKAPDFTVYTADGSTVKLSDLLGKPTVVNFWASWCGPCRGELPDFQTVWAEMGDDVNFVMVNLTGGSDTQAAAEKLIAAQGYTFPVYFDVDNDAATAYSIFSIPVTVFIDAEGNLISSRIGMMDEQALRDRIALITQ